MIYEYRTVYNGCLDECPNDVGHISNGNKPRMGSVFCMKNCRYFKSTIWTKKDKSGGTYQVTCNFDEIRSDELAEERRAARARVARQKREDSKYTPKLIMDLPL